MAKSKKRTISESEESSAVKKERKALSQENGDDTLTKKKKKKTSKLSEQQLSPPKKTNERKAISDLKEKKREKMKLKKEKKVQQQEAATENVASSNLEYLQMFCNQRSQWKFNKAKQIWLLKHLYDEDKMSDSDFELMLEYMENMKGNACEVSKEQAEKHIDQKDAEVSQKKMERARQILQILS